MLRGTNRNLAAGEKFQLKRKNICKWRTDELDNGKTGQRVVKVFCAASFSELFEAK